jgi:hypothetical protein
MENSNSLTSTILQPNDVSISSTNTPSNWSGDSSGFFDSFKSINLTTWLIVVLILAFLGFNIFVYLANGTKDITNVFAPIMQKLFGTTVAVTGQTVDVTAEGAKAVVSGTAGTVNTGLTAIQNITPNKAPSSIPSQSVQGTIPQKDITSNNTLNKALNSSQSQQENSYEANEASSSVNTGKSGWCFIGDDRGYRSCAEVGVNDTCMSGDIFPSQEICINPNLRP